MLMIMKMSRRSLLIPVPFFSTGAGVWYCNMQADYKALIGNYSGTSHDILTMTSEITVAPA